MAHTLEREVKLRFHDAEAARQAILAIGASPLRSRRLQQDYLLDTRDGHLRQQGAILRVRMDPAGGSVTFKGAVQASHMKLREEVETGVGEPAILLAILERTGLEVWFRYEKYREEFAAGGVVVALDETPVGVYVELEGEESGVTSAALALGRGPSEYVLDSYRSLFVEYCGRAGLPVTHMLFERT